ncbi:MAG: SIR2 family protein [Firmicutes bacterium]|nr:SIR2 family protein [Bacillota bacterium]
MIDRQHILAIALHAGPGRYALLAGSGVSRAAGILTGWGIVEDLIRRLARLEGTECGGDPAEWYREHHGGAQPEYSQLLEAVAPTPEERQQLLRSYFEPTDEDRVAGRKVPTRAHLSAAELVRLGYLRVIVTTNFDGLFEQALDAVGASYRVVSTPGEIAGMTPLVHQGNFVVKVNGDYRDPGIRNTATELSEYDEATNALLDRIFDDFGLVVVGWSATWDTALYGAIMRSRSRRYTTFWAARGETTEEARRLIAQRDAIEFPIESADAFLADVQEQVSALRTVAEPMPLTREVAVARLKKYIVDAHSRIDLHDLVWREVESFVRASAAETLPTESPGEIHQRLDAYDRLLAVLVPLFVNGCYWGDESHHPLWRKALERLLNSSAGGSPDIDRYPALVLAYAGGLAAIAARKYGTFQELLVQPLLYGPNRRYPLVLRAYPAMIRALRHDPLNTARTRISDRLYRLFRPEFLEFLPQEQEYTDEFDRMEYLAALTANDQGRQLGLTTPYLLLGRFSWRNREDEPDRTVMAVVGREYASLGAEWPPLRAGMLGGQRERFETAKASLDQEIERHYP